MAIRQALWRLREDLQAAAEVFPGQQANPLLRRALGIPADLALRHSNGAKVLQYLGGFFLPKALILWWVRALLRRVRSYHGRAVLYCLVLRRLLPQLSYTPGLDFVLLRLQGTVTHGELQRLSLQDAAWLQAAHVLGARTAAQMVRAMDRSAHRVDGALVRLLAEEGVIATLAELQAWPGHPAYRPNDRVSARELVSARQVVRRVLRLGMDRQAILQGCKGDAPAFRTEHLEANLALLAEHGVDGAQVGNLVGSLLWTASSSRWGFLLKTLGIATPADLALFIPLLQSRGEPSQELAHELVTIDRTPASLSACQGILTLASSLPDPSAAVRVVHALVKPPFLFGLADIGRLRASFHHEDRLGSLLAELSRHGITRADDVLTFESACLHLATGTGFDQILALAVERRQDASVEALANWVQRAAKLGNADAIDILATLLRLDSLAALDKALALVPLGTTLLRYLVVDKRLDNLAGLLRWFRDDANGILGVQWHGPLDDLGTLLLDDAFKRKRFGVFKHNVHCAYEAALHRATEGLGTWPDWRDTARLEARHAVEAQRKREQRPKLLEDMREMLRLTGGVLLASVLRCPAADRNALQARLSEVSPLLDEIATGGGPAHESLTDMEAEAIGLVYRVAPGLVRERWTELVGREGDLAPIQRRPHYPMRWKNAKRRLRVDASLDTRGLVALANVAQRARLFAESCQRDMSVARNGLKPRRFNDPAVDEVGLTQHFAVLCGLVLQDDNVAHTLARWHDARGAFAAGSVPYAEFEHLQAFLATALPDALQARLEGRLRSLEPAACTMLADRLGVRLHADTISPHQALAESLTAVQRKVTERWTKWAAREARKFELIGDEQGETTVHAVLTKSPAAFFAKEAAGLCTKARTDMWQEPRHSHLVVFEPTERRLVGMALVYVECIDEIDRMRPSLVIRAINPLEDAAAQHTVGSIVDAFLSTAIQIAQDNDLAAAAFPAEGGTLVSNLPAIERDVRERLVGRSYRGFQQRPSSAADRARLDRPTCVSARFDGYVRGEGSVSSLHVVWQRDTASTSADVG